MPSNPSSDQGSHGCARPDFDRLRRKGMPEVILADRKTMRGSLAIAGRFLGAQGRAILSRVPIVGLPTSVGYGLGGDGVAALLTMLQTCAPGLSFEELTDSASCVL
jgi:NCAIR mutase (PurE)-related protein